ncbi:DNA mismatch repair protein Msh6, partial [Nosema bombycis CQ1]
MKKNLFDYFNSSQEIKLDSCTPQEIKLDTASQKVNILDTATQKENLTNDDSQIYNQEKSELTVSFPSDVCKDWSSEDEKLKKKKIKNELVTKEEKDAAVPGRYEFLINVKDKYGRSIDDKDYDKSTLLITEKQLSKLTPFERQFWEIKKDYFDTIVFFKKGKFYELYEEDASISARLFDMKITERVNMRMTGFPESSYDEWAARFLDAGFKIARVEQSENAIGKQIREKGGKKDKIINRELVEVVTQGTIYDMNHIKTNHSTFLCAIRKHSLCPNLKDCKADNPNHHFSILLYDSSTFSISSSTFCDDQYFTSLRGYFYKYPIMEYLSDIKYDFGSIWVKPDNTTVVSDTKSILNEEEYLCYSMRNSMIVNFIFILIICIKNSNNDIHFKNDVSLNFNIKNNLKLRLENFLKNFKISKDEILPDKNNKDELNILIKEKETSEEKFLKFLEDQKKILKSKSINYKSVGKEIYQIEVPKDFKVPDEWYLVSKTKSTNRYYTEIITQLVKEYVEIEEKIFQSQGCLLNRAIKDLLEGSKVFEEAIFDIANLDCFISFSKFNEKNECCTPRLGDKIKFKGLTNPIYSNYIPNDYDEESRILVLTGSNMSGKSTFMRSLTLNIILFQMGMNVCASEFESPLFDRIFTRIGASDNLGRGESTFMVELLEMSSVLRYATDKSFVVVDELGRGTSIKDGKIIAKAVVNKLKKMKCRVLFSTHYHNLLKGVSSYFMDSKVVDHDLLFLYKLKKGECEDSNGIYVAKMAGVPLEIIDSAWEYRKKIFDDRNKKNCGDE